MEDQGRSEACYQLQGMEPVLALQETPRLLAGRNTSGLDVEAGCLSSFILLIISMTVHRYTRL